MPTPDSELVELVRPTVTCSCGHPLAEHYESGCGWCICKVAGTATEDANQATATATCGARASLGSVHDDYPAEFTCDLPVGHRGWHRDLSEEDEYRWAK